MPHFDRRNFLHLGAAGTALIPFGRGAFAAPKDGTDDGAECGADRALFHGFAVQLQVAVVHADVTPVGCARGGSCST